jgi:alcohol dehydrogenase YqhD (iron-dependent ADH family)
MDKHEDQYSGFDLCLYTEYFMEDDAAKKAGALIRKYGGTKVLLVYDMSVKALGLDKTVVDSIKASGLACVEMPDGVVPNPRRSLVERGVDFAKAEKVDFVLGMGGGSTIDSTKAISLGLEYDGPVWDIYSHKVQPVKKAKCGVIPTIAASGSDGSRASVLLDDIDTHQKSGIGLPFNRPLFVILDPKLTFTVPKKQTASGAADAFGHTFERYFMCSQCHLADQFALGVMRNIRKYSVIAYRDPTNYEARREMQLSALFGHNDITEVGRSGRHGGAHDLANQYFERLDAPHGISVAMMMAPWLEFIAEKGDDFEVGKAARLATEVFGVEADYENPKAVALEGAKRLRDWFREMGLPMTFSEYGIDPATVSLDELVDAPPFGPDGLYNGFHMMTRDDVRYVLEKVLK